MSLTLNSLSDSVFIHRDITDRWDKPAWNLSARARERVIWRIRLSLSNAVRVDKDRKNLPSSLSFALTEFADRRCHLQSGLWIVSSICNIISMFLSPQSWQNAVLLCISSILGTGKSHRGLNLVNTVGDAWLRCCFWPKNYEQAMTIEQVIVIRRFSITIFFTASVFSLIVDVLGRPERESSFTSSRPSVKSLYHL